MTASDGSPTLISSIHSCRCGHERRRALVRNAGSLKHGYRRHPPAAATGPGGPARHGARFRHGPARAGRSSAAAARRPRRPRPGARRRACAPSLGSTSRSLSSTPSGCATPSPAISATRSRTTNPCSILIKPKLVATLELIVAALLIAVIIAFSSARPRPSAPGPGSTSSPVLFVVTGLAIPSYWLGLILLLVFAVSLKWLPVSGYVPLADDPLDNLKHLVLPALSLGSSRRPSSPAFCGPVCSIRCIRTMSAPRTPRDWRSGPSSCRHALKNALIPMVTVLGTGAGHAGRRRGHHRAGLRLVRGSAGWRSPR